MQSSPVGGSVDKLRVTFPKELLLSQLQDVALPAKVQLDIITVQEQQEQQQEQEGQQQQQEEQPEGEQGEISSSESEGCLAWLRCCCTA